MTDKSLTLLISKILTNTKEKSIKELCKELYSIGILTKEYI